MSIFVLFHPFLFIHPTIECGCSTIGSNTTSTVCDHTTGQCQCLPNVEGQQCSQCAPNHYGLSSGSGCTSCDCHPEGAESSQCDVETGQCSCRLGVTGRACNQCLPGYFGLSSQGCQSMPSTSSLPPPPSPLSPPPSPPPPPPTHTYACIVTRLGEVHSYFLGPLPHMEISISPLTL